jgi:hypothetical protein
MREFLFTMLVLACPLMMILMMRGMHGHGRNAQADPQLPRDTMSLDELKQERDKLNELIGERAEQIAHSGTADQKWSRR